MWTIQIIANGVEHSVTFHRFNIEHDSKLYHVYIGDKNSEIVYDVEEFDPTDISVDDTINEAVQSLIGNFDWRRV